MKKLKTGAYYNEFIHSTKELDILNKLNKDNEYKDTKQEIFNDMPSSEEMLSRVQDILKLCENKDKKLQLTKPRKLLLIAALVTFLFSAFSMGVSGNLYKFFDKIINVKDAKYLQEENLVVGEMQDYEIIKQLMKKLEFKPMVPKYLPNGIKLLSIEPIVNKNSIDLYFVDDNSTFSIREKKANDDYRNVGAVADTKNSTEKTVCILGKDVTVYFVERKNENESFSFRWSIGDIQYSIMSSNISYNEIIKIIESLYYLN